MTCLEYGIRVIESRITVVQWVCVCSLWLYVSHDIDESDVLKLQHYIPTHVYTCAHNVRSEIFYTVF